MKLDSLDGIIIPNNNVLVKLPSSYSDMLHNEKKVRELFINTSFKPGFHAPRCGTLIANPQKLIFGAMYMSWKTEIETVVGDTVWFNYVPAMAALGKMLNPVLPTDDDLWFEHKGDVYLLLPYESLVCVRRGESEFCVNGNVLGKRIEEKQSDMIAIKNRLTERLILTHTGEPVTEYINEVCEVEDVDVGDTVVIRGRGENIMACELENGMDNTFSKEKLYFFQRKQIIGKID